MSILIYFGPSPRENKRFVARFKNPSRTTHFGQPGANTYIDGASKETRQNYLKRHARDLETGDPLMAGYLSYYVIWGKSRDVEDNLKSYMSRFNIKDNRKK